MIKTKSVYYDKVEEEDGVRILIMRHWCRPLSKEKAKIDEWLRELAPSRQLLEDWNNHRIHWPEYKRRYLEEMKGQKENIRKLTKRAKTETITLLCKELADEHCHRKLLKSLIDDLS